MILVGAGPGDPGLLTLRGKEALEQAEVVVYDRLVGRGILDLAPPEAERIDVGKSPDRHPVPQAEINALLVEKARQGKRVVRLKGGDPFLFGRGGEELAYLAQNGVPFQEVPGVPSAIAVPAYGGIPVTHRDYSSSLHIVTGHRQAGRPLDIPFEALVKAGGTLVFLMGVGALEEICRGLLSAGMDPDAPAALVEQGTTPRQRVISGRVGTLPRQARAENARSPAVILVGEVCRFAEELNWFARLPLMGKQVIVTRPKERAGELCGKLRALGAAVTEFPCIETAPLVPCPALEAAVEHIADYAWLAFTSPAGVEALAGYLDRKGEDVRALGGIKLAAIGPGTAEALRKQGLRAALVPKTYDGVHLGEALGRQRPRGRVLLLRAREGTPALSEALKAAGVPYDDVACYETRYPCPDGAAVRELLGQSPYVTFTSGSTVRGFVAAVGPGADLSKVIALCLGPQTAAQAQKQGMRTMTAKEATIDSLVERMLEEAGG